MKIAALILFFLAAICFVQAQNLDIGVTVNPGISRFSKGDLDEFESDSKIENNWKLSGNLGMYLNKPFSKMSSIGLELLLNYVENEEKQSAQLYYFEDVNGNVERIVVGNSEQIYHTHLSYAALPIYYQLTSGRISFRLGIQTQFISLSNFDYTESIIIKPTGGSSTLTKNNAISMMNKVDYGLKTGILFYLSNRMALRFEYYHGIKSINNELNRFMQSIRQLTLGLQYSLTQKKKTNE